MKLPHVDVYREPFIVPLGHLAMQAARAENELIALCARTSNPPISDADAAHALRNWGAPAKAFALSRLDLISDAAQRDRALDAFHRYDALRDARHRAIHDAVEVGIEGDGPLYSVVPLSIQHKRTDRATTVRTLTKITPEAIADLACEYYEVQQDFGSIAT